VGYWTLDEAAGASTIADSSQSGNTGTVQAGVTTGIVGKVGKGVTFNGSSGYIGMSNGPGITTQATFSFWINASQLEGQLINYAISLGSSGTLRPSIAVGGTYSDSQFPGKAIGIFDGTNASASIANSFTQAAMAGSWHHIVVTYNNSATPKTQIYLDSVALAMYSNNLTGSFSSQNQINLGRRVDGVWYLNGSLDEVAIWNTALTATQIQTIYQRQSAKYAGQVTSRVMDAMSLQSWTTLSSTTTLPFYKELPSSASSESSTNYSSQSSSLMNGIVGLWHLDETEGSPSVSDATGNGHSGTPSAGVTLGATGILSNSASFNGSGGITVSSFSLGNAFSLSAWVNPGILDGNIRCIVRPNSNSGSLYLWGNTFKFYDNSNNVIIYPGVLSVGAWYHVVATYDGTTKRLYVNGNLVGNSVETLTSATSLTIGTDAWSQNFSGQIDEVAVWNRALCDGTNVCSSNEILELYRRGANRLKYQFRSCPDSTCSTNPTWQGPDGTNQSYFSELYNTTSNIFGGTVLTGSPTMTFSNFSGSGLSVSSNRYFQYRTILESDDANSLCNYGSGATACSPELQSVTVGPNHYDTSAPTVISSAAIGHSYQTLSSFVESLGTSGCSGGAKYALSPNGSTYYYWNGTTWSSSSGTYATASPGTDLATNISTFPGVAGTGTLQVMSFLNSTGTTPCQISNLQFGGQSY
jgi:trimeric autotransporter adhesin